MYCAVKIVLQSTSKVIEQLNEIFPLENIRHLKRIRKVKEQGKQQKIQFLFKK